MAHISASADTVPISDAALRSEMAFHIAVALANYYTKGQELVPENQLQRAREIAQNIGDKAQELKVIWMLYGWAGNVGHYRQELLYAQSFVEAARGSEDPITESRCNRMLGRGFSHLGQHACAQKHIEQALRSIRSAMPRVALHAYDANDYIAARATYAKILWLRGYADDANTEAEQCIAEALAIGQEQSICWAIVFNICPVAIWRGDFGRARTLVSLLLERSQGVFEHYHQWGLLYRQFLGELVTASGQWDAVWNSDIKPKIPAQADLFSTFDGGFLGADAFARAQADEDVWCTPELLRVRACRAAPGDDEASPLASEAMLLRSLDLAKRQDAKAWELRTATSLARLYLKSTRRSEGSAVLKPVLEQLKQGRDTRDVQSAVNVLHSLVDG